jgi:glycosyltransferase 2 family protein
LDNIRWLSYGVVELLATVRWQMLLRIQGITLGWLRTFAIVMIGLFFNMFLPGLIAGDAVRLYFVFKCAPRQKTLATLSVAMDRILGMLSILFLTGLSLAVRFGWLSRSGATLHIVYLVMALLGVGCVCVLLLFAAVHFGLLHKLPKRMPFRSAIAESGKALQLYGAHLGVMSIAFAITVVAHIMYYLSFYCAAESLYAMRSASLSVTDILSIMPLVNTVTALPISFGGVGVRETLFQELLGNLAHVPPAIAAVSASLGFAIQASWGLLGAVVFLAAKKLKSD